MKEISWHNCSVWIVEMWWENHWSETHGIGMTREEGRIKLKEWQNIYPDDKFRLTRYDASR